MRSATYVTLCAAAILVMVLAGSEVATAVTCVATELAPCAGAMSSSWSPPSQLCCKKIKEQKPCLCQYLKNPSLRAYVTSPNAKKVATTCGIPIPNC